MTVCDSTVTAVSHRIGENMVRTIRIVATAWTCVAGLLAGCGGGAPASNSLPPIDGDTIVAPYDPTDQIGSCSRLEPGIGREEVWLSCPAGPHWRARD